jgi:glycerophosphoryl diester phosphodiesterase
MSMTRIYAHRGANREAAENSRTAFERALAYPIDGMETDVQLSLDGVPVLWHDGFLGKLGMPARRVDDCTLAELQAMDFAMHFGRGAKPEGIMPLRDFVSAYSARCDLVLEIKSRDHENRARLHSKIQQTMDLARGARAGGVLVSSFHLPSLMYAHDWAPDFPLVYNGESNLKVREAERLLDAYPFLRGLCVHQRTLDKQMADMLRSRNKTIAVYTCNTEEEIRRALDLAANILITDYPQKALQMRDA